MVMLGYAYQVGALPLSAASIERAIALNGEAVAMNTTAFRWGRRIAADPKAIEALNIPAPGDATDARRLSQNFDETVARRVAFLTDYQDAAYAARYRARVEQAKAAEAAKAPGKCGLAEAVARNLFKLMAYKDEYEVARLYSDGAFLRQAAAEFDGKLRFTFHLAPPLLARRDPATGEPRKMTFGPWMMRAFGLLAKLKFLRGTAFDLVRPHARSAAPSASSSPTTKRCSTRCCGKLTPENHHLAVGLAAIPEKIRGFGHVKAAPSRRRQGRRGGAARPVPRGPAASAEGGGVGAAYWPPLRPSARSMTILTWQSFRPISMVVLPGMSVLSAVGASGSGKSE